MGDRCSVETRSSRIEERKIQAPVSVTGRPARGDGGRRLPTSDGSGRPAADDDLVLIDRILSGDEEAFRDLVARFGDRLFRLVYGIIGDWHLSEDVVQDVFVLVHRKLSGFDRRSSLMTWLYRVTVNVALKARRRSRRHALLPMVDGFDQAARGPGIERGCEMREIGTKLLRCLPAKLRVVVLLREWEGLRYEEIARVLRCSRGAVEQRLHRAMVELRRVWIPAVREEWFDGL
jgi:RNA polymerase sigma-70 factor, ECF subfamily